jgi:hypothetical protein
MESEDSPAISQSNGRFFDNKRKVLNRVPGRSENLEAQDSNKSSQSVTTPIHDQKSKSTDNFRGSRLKISSSKNSSFLDEDELSPTLPDLSPKDQEEENSKVKNFQVPKTESILEESQEDFESPSRSLPSQKPMNIDLLLTASKPDLER